MLKNIVALFTQRNLHPSIWLETLGDWLILPLNYILALHRFNIIEQDDKRFTYLFARENPWINSQYKFIALSMVSLIFTPIALLGGLCKMVGLLFSKKMRDIYLNWQPPSKLEFSVIAHNEDDTQLVHAWNNQAIIQSAINVQCASLLMRDIVKNSKQWFILGKSSALTNPGPSMSLTPDIMQTYHKDFNLRRQRMENNLNLHTQKLAISQHTISYLSLGDKGFLPQLMNAYVMLCNNFKQLNLVLIDPYFKREPDGMEAEVSFKPPEEQAQLFIAFLKALAKEHDSSVTIQFFQHLDELPKGAKFDVISAIDFTHEQQAFFELSHAHKHVKKGGRLFLAAMDDDFTYDDKNRVATNTTISLALDFKENKPEPKPIIHSLDELDIILKNKKPLLLSRSKSFSVSRKEETEESTLRLMR